MTYPPQPNPWAQPPVQQPPAQAYAPQSQPAPPAAQQPQGGFQGMAQAEGPAGFSAASSSSVSPTVPDLRGRLLLITPLSTTTATSTKFGGRPYDVVVADVAVLDGGPVHSTNPDTPGMVFDGHEFHGMWLTGSRVVNQLRNRIGNPTPVLGRIDTRYPGTEPKQGNPWGIDPFTDTDAELARRYQAGDRSFTVPLGTVPQPTAPPAQPSVPWAQPAPQAAAPYTPQANASTWAPQAPAQTAPAANPWANGPQAPQAPANPWAPQQ